MSLDPNCGAVISPCGLYRSMLWRVWDKRMARLVMIMLNPSTADGTCDDPTVVRCISRARMLGCGQLWIVNLFDFRATEPAAMLAADKPSSGAPNDAAIQLAIGRHNGMVIAGWGEHGGHRGRDAEVIEMVTQDLRRPLYALRLTKGGHPGHPLYVGYDVQPFVWKEAV